MIECRMKIDKILFPKNKQIESGEFSIFTAKVIEVKTGCRPIEHDHFKTVTLKGNVPHFKTGNVFDIKFENPETNKFGTSYSVISVTREVDPKNEKDLFDYYKLIAGEKIAKELILVKNSFEILKSRKTEELLKIKGIGNSKLEKIYENIGNYSDFSYAYAKLEKLGLSKKLIQKICLSVGGAIAAVDICKTNPYSLIKKIHGVGFLVADSIGLKCGIDLNNLERLEQAILYILETEALGGKNFLSAAQLFTNLRNYTTLGLDGVSEIVKKLETKGEIKLSKDGYIIGLTEYIELEQNIAKELLRIKNSKSKIIIPSNWKHTIKEIEINQGWSHTLEQIEGIEKVLNNNLVVITGKAGSGKSTVTNAMSEILKEYQIELCCLAAKAAQRLTEVTGLEAQTIHRLLGIGMDFGVESELYSDIIILDEASMVSGTLFLKLLKAIPSGSKLIILGDDGQLTAIGDCSVFSDLLKAPNIVKVELTKIHRQAEKSAIITRSIDIRNQKNIYEKGFFGTKILGELQDLKINIHKENNNLLETIIGEFKSNLHEVKNILEVQIITPLKTRGEISIEKINIEIQKIYNPKLEGSYVEGINNTRIYRGDKIINTKNNYKAKNTDGQGQAIYNGSIGVLKEIRDNDILVYFVGLGDIIIEKNYYKFINLAYAISVHSSQGSQWDRVICGFDMSAYTLLNVEILYTAITRAVKYCVLVTTDKAMRFALKKVEQKTKQTLLVNYL